MKKQKKRKTYYITYLEVAVVLFAAIIATIVILRATVWN